VFAVEDVALRGVDGHALQHAYKVERGEFLDEAEAGLHAVVVGFERGEEEGEDDGEAGDLGCPCDNGGGVAAEVDEASVHEEGEGDAEGGHAAG